MGEFIKKRDEKGRIVKGNDPGPGRPLGSFSLVTILKNKLAELGPDQKRTYAETLIENMLQDALEHNDTARKLTFNYSEGLPKQHIEAAVTFPKPLDDVSEDEEEDTLEQG
jgi:hypothetical protein